MRKFSIPFCLAVCFLWACGGQRPGEQGNSSPTPKNSEQGTEAAYAASDQPAEEKTDEDIWSSAAARGNPADTFHKFIRTASIKMRVKDVAASTLRLEDLAVEAGGFVVHSDLRSDELEIKKVREHPDSVTHITSFRIVAQITFRVPVESLDSVLRVIGRESVFMNSRIVHAEEVQFQYMAAQTRVEATAKSDQMTYSMAALERMRIEDQMKFSTIQVEIYQHEEELVETFAAPVTVDSYESHFDYALEEAFDDGWRILRFFLLLAVRFWGLLLVALVVFVIVFFTVRKRK